MDTICARILSLIPSARAWHESWTRHFSHDIFFNTGVLIDHRPEQQQAQAILIFTKYILGLSELNGTSCWICLTGQLGRKDVNLLD
jgi:hypothetical protein